MRRFLACVALLCVLFASPLTAASTQQPPLGSFVVGADPAILGIVQEGVVGWNATGAVAFSVVEGCGVGDVFFCIEPTERADSIAGWNIVPGNRISVNPGMMHLFEPSTVCHELGHFLGLRWFADGSIYHRSDGLSCMSVWSPDRPAAPDAIDLANLGVAVAAEPEPAAQEPAPRTDEPPVVGLPNTGTGSAAG